MKRASTAAPVLVVAAFLLAFSLPAFGGGAILTPSGDLRIPKREVTATATFYPYTASGGVKMEIFAVRAPDGSIRTAFNTCQVCYSSGRGYFTQKGQILVCNNCGNQFSVSQVELVRGGCNPVPIAKDVKTEDADYITIPKAIFEKTRPLFLRWRR